MSGPQGPDQTQPWPGQDQPSSDPSNQPPAWQQPAPGQDQPAWQQQPPAYSPQQYPSYQQPGQQPLRSRRSSTRRPSSTVSSRPRITASRPIRSTASSRASTGSSRGSTVSSRGSTASIRSTARPRRPEGSKRSLALVGGVIGLLAALVVAVVAVLGFWKPGFFVTTKLDVGAAQSGVQQILTDESNGYGAKNVKDVKCNNGESPTVKKGETFDCEVSIDGTKRQVTVTFQDNNGTYEVGRPK